MPNPIAEGLCPSSPAAQAKPLEVGPRELVDIVIVTGDRTDAEQLIDYAKGRQRLPDGSWVVVDASKVVTRALGAKSSAHGHRSGLDFHPVKALLPNGNVASIYLGDAKVESPEDFAEGLQRFKIVIATAKAMDLESGEDFQGLCDRPHLQDPAWAMNPLGPGVAA